MKIIFDNEEQKNTFLNFTAKGIFCPDDFGLRYNELYCEKLGDDCVFCWENAVEMEVKEND